MEVPAASTNAELVETEVLMLVHTAPFSHCHTPSVPALAALAVIAIPASALAEEPPSTWSVASLNAAVNSAETAAPGGLAVSSATEARLTLAAVRVGASLTGVMVRLAVSVALEKAVVPPLVEVSTLVAARPLD